MLQVRRDGNALRRQLRKVAEVHLEHARPRGLDLPVGRTVRAYDDGGNVQHVVVAALVRSSRLLLLIAILGVLVPRSVVIFVETGRLCVQNYASRRSPNPTFALVDIDRSYRVHDDERVVFSLRSSHYASN